MNSKDPHIGTLLGALAIAIAPHIVRLPVWIILWCIALWGYRLIIQLRNRRLPGSTSMQLLTVAGFAGGVASYGVSFDMDVGVGLLSIMVGLKPLEIRTHRDRMMTIFLTFFMVITNLLYTNSLFMTFYMVVSVLITTAVLIHITHPAGRLGSQLRLSALIMAQAIPLAILLFVLFPRIQGSFWGSPKRNVSVTGFTDRLTPGSVSTLVQSDEVAFRAEFKGPIPAPNRLYWRGMVFNRFDGRTWSPGIKARLRSRAPTGTGPVDYTVVLEPHGQRWLYTLDLPKSGLVAGAFLSDHTLVSRRKIRRRTRYRVRSFMNYRTGPMEPWEASSLLFPPHVNPEAIELANQWRKQSNDPEKIVKTALSYFRKNRFYYTLNTPLLGRDTVDDFLFRSKKGFCEHYASAFTFLMRAAGIPARIVGGYLGGEINPYGNYLIVRQTEAHVWTEVWLSKQGWVRIDPTSTIAPDRIERGVAAALAPDERGVLEGITGFGPLIAYWKKIELGWDLVNSSWDRWVLGFSYLRQQRIYARIGLKDGFMKGSVLTGIIVTGAAGFVLFRWKRRKKRKPASGKDPVQQMYLLFCRKLADAGLARQPAQGPLDYAAWIGESRPDISVAVMHICRQYIDLRYAETGDEVVFAAYRTAVKRFRPGKPEKNSPKTHTLL